jgi:hypothetical protein
MAGGFFRFVNFLAKMGLIVRADPPRHIATEGLEWGDAADGMMLSIREIPSEDPDQLAAIAVVMKNAGAKTWNLTIPGWMFFFHVETTAPLSAFGRQLLRPENQKEKMDIVVGPGDATQTDIPVGSMYEIRRGEYPVEVNCTLPDGVTLRSNRIVIRASH